MKIAIIGAGLSGVMAYKFFKEMDYVESIKVFEKSPAESFLTNHSAILRVKTLDVINILKCRYSEIKIEKNYFYDDCLSPVPTIKSKNEYSRKVTGEIHERSIGMENENRTRYLIELSSIKVDLYDFCFSTDFFSQQEKFDVIISTIPMPDLLLKKKISLDEEFCLKAVATINAKSSVKINTNQTIYVSDPEYSCYRISIQQNQAVIAEFADLDPEISYGEFNSLIELFALQEKDMSEIKHNVLSYGKIIPINSDYRKHLIMKLSEEYSIYSLGRFAIWKNSVGADDVAKDIRKIETMLRINKWERKYENKLS